MTSTLIGRGNVPRVAIGSTNAAEFFVTTVIAIAFFALIGMKLWVVILGLVTVVAAPFAALATRKLPDRPLMLIVGVMVILLSVRSLLIALGGG